MNDAPAFQLETSGNRLILSLLPKLNKVAWADIDSIGAEILARLSSYSTPRVLVDLCQLDYMGSAQVALIVRIYKAVKEKSGLLVVANRHPVVQEVLTLAGLNKLWTIVGSREEGLRTLGGDPGRPTSPEGVATTGGSNAGTLILVSLMAAIIGSVCLVAAFTRAPWLPSPAAGWVALASAVLALGLAAMATLHALGQQKLVGTGVLLYGMALLLGSVLAIASPATSSEAKPEQASSTGSDTASEDSTPEATDSKSDAEEPQTATPEDERPAKS